MSAKKIVQDIVPSERRSIRNVPVNHPVERNVTEAPILVKKVVNKKKKNRGVNMFASFIVVFVCIAIIGIALSLSYSKAVVTISPKVMNLQVDGKFTARKDVQETDLRYEITTVTDEMHKVVSAIDGPLIQTKAKGTAVLYNNYSTTTQKLIAGTRLLNSKGLIYKTLVSMSIPGKKMINGKIIPRSVSVAIIADQAGENYNTKLVDLSGDFKIFSYKGTDKYNDFYGRLKSDMTGGFSGNKKIISSEIQQQTIQELEDSLKSKLTNKLKLAIPEGYIFYNDSYIVDNKVLDIGTKDTGSADIGVKSTVYGIIFDSNNLLNFVAGNEIKKFPSTTYNVKGIKDLVFKIMNAKDFSITKTTPITFSLKGPLSIIGTFSEETLKNELKGISLSASKAIFAKYTPISNAHVLLTPFWVRSFPNSSEKITIEYKSE